MFINYSDFNKTVVAYFVSTELSSYFCYSLELIEYGKNNN